MHLKLVNGLRCDSRRISLILLILLRKHVPLQLITFEVIDLLFEELDVGDSPTLGCRAEILAIDYIDTAMLLLHLLQLHG